MSVLLRLNPLFAPFLRRVIGPDTPEIEVLQPAETVSVLPPAMLPCMLGRVTATDEHSNLSYHVQAAEETVVTHAPVLRRVYRNALVQRHGFATLRQNNRFVPGISRAEFTDPILHVRRLRYCYNLVIWRYFGHWLTDAIPSSLIEPDAGDLWMPHHPSWHHAAEYLQPLNINLLSASLVHAEDMVEYQDFGQGSHKQRRYAILRDRLHARYGSDDGPLCVYIRRGRTGVARLIANEDALVDALLARNWHVLDVATDSVEDIHRILCCAEVVASIEGSHIDHAHLSLQTGAAMVLLVPNDRFTLRQIGPCRALGRLPGFVVLNGSQAQGYQADADELLRTVDLALAARET